MEIVDKPGVTEPEQPTAAESVGGAGEQVADAAPDAGPNVGHLAVRGVAWSTAMTLCTKFVAIFQQYLIAKFFLGEGDFGLVAMGQVVISLAFFGHGMGVSEIMARRHRSFQKWAQAAIWMNVCMELVGICIILSIIPSWNFIYRGVSSLFGGHRTDVPQIQSLLAVWCLGYPFDGVATILNTRLRVDLRFRAWSLIGTVQTLGMALLSIIFASLGMGAMSLVLPVPIMMIFCMFLSLRLSGQRIGLDPKFHRWGSLFKDARYFLISHVFAVLLQQGDYLITGVFFEKAIVGAYYFAFRMSAQTVQFISANLGAILVPSFAQIDHDQLRLHRAYERTCASLLFIGMPLCFLQALLAVPLFHLVFGDKWHQAVELFQILSLAMGFTLPLGTAGSLLIAQNRLRLNMIMTVAQGVIFVSFVLIGALCGNVRDVALCVGCFYLLFGPLAVALPIWRDGFSAVTFVFRIYRFPVLASVASVAAGWCATYWMRMSGDLAVIGIRGSVWLMVFIAIVAVVRPKVAMDLRPRISGILQRLVKR